MTIMNNPKEAKDFLNVDPFLNSLNDSEKQKLLSVERIEFNNDLLETLYIHSIPSCYPETFLFKLEELDFDLSTLHIINSLDWNNPDSFQKNTKVKNELLASYHIARSLGLLGWGYDYVKPLRPWQAIHVYASWLVFSLLALEELKKYSVNPDFEVLDSPMENDTISGEIDLGISKFLTEFNISAEEYARALYLFCLGDYTSPLVQIEKFEEEYIKEFNYLPMFPSTINDALIMSGYSASIITADENVPDQVNFRILQAFEYTDSFDDLWTGKTDSSHE